MDGANVCRQEEVRLQHHPVDHHHRRRPPRARLFRARPAPLSGGGVRTTRRGAFWGASSLGSRTVRLRGPSLGRQPLQARAGRGAQVRRNALDERELAGYERARLRRNGGGLSARRRHGLSPRQAVANVARSARRKRPAQPPRRLGRGRADEPVIQVRLRRYRAVRRRRRRLDGHISLAVFLHPTHRWALIGHPHSPIWLCG